MCGNACPASVSCFNGACAGAGDCEAAPGCQECVNCAAEGLCTDELSTCALNQDCVDLVACLEPCMDQQCFDMCGMQFPNGILDYNSYVECLFCQECPTDCGTDPGACPVPCDSNMTQCDTCLACALDPAGNCDDEDTICNNDPECSAIFACLNMCQPGDQMCADQCYNDHAAGIPAYNAWILCNVCQECPISCNGPQVGCP
jgi:hypothetical protein